MKNFFNQIQNFFKLLKKNIYLKIKAFFPLTFEERKAHFKKRVWKLPFIILAIYFIISYIDYILLHRSLELFLSEGWFLQPDWIDFPIDEEDNYYESTNQFIILLISSGIAFIFYYILTLFIYELQSFMLKSYLFVNSVFYFWFCVNDPIDLIFYTVYYLGGPSSWISYFYNWFWYWGWNIFQWAIDLEEEIEENEDQEEEEQAAELQRLSNTISKTFFNKGIFNVDIFKNVSSLFFYMYKEMTLAWTLAQEAEDNYKPKEKKEWGMNKRYRRHILKFHPEAIAQEDLYQELFIEKYKDLRDSVKDTHWQDYTFFKYNKIVRRQTWNFRKYLWFYIRFLPRIQTLYIFWRYCTEYKPWFSKPKRIVGRYSLYTKKYSQLSYNKILLRYYKLEQKTISDKIINFLNFFLNSIKNFFYYKKIFVFRKTIKQWIFFLRQKRLWNRQLNLINKRFNRKKRIIDSLYFRKRNI